MTDDEKEKLSKIYNNDFFNVVHDVYDYDTKNILKRITLNMNHDALEKVDVSLFKWDYEKRENGCIVTKKATDENLGEIIFKMKN